MSLEYTISLPCASLSFPMVLTCGRLYYPQIIFSTTPVLYSLLESCSYTSLHQEMESNSPPPECRQVLFAYNQYKVVGVMLCGVQLWVTRGDALSTSSASGFTGRALCHHVRSSAIPRQPCCEKAQATGRG